MPQISQSSDARRMMRGIAVHPVGALRVHVRFDDGTEKTIDLDSYLRPAGPMVQPLRADPDLFQAVTVERGTRAWPNGFDLDPDTRYYDDLAPGARTDATAPVPTSVT